MQQLHTPPVSAQLHKQRTRAGTMPQRSCCSQEQAGMGGRRSSSLTCKWGAEGWHQVSRAECNTWQAQPAGRRKGACPFRLAGSERPAPLLCCKEGLSQPHKCAGCCAN